MRKNSPNSSGFPSALIGGIMRDARPHPPPRAKTDRPSALSGAMKAEADGPWGGQWAAATSLLEAEQAGTNLC